MAENNTRQPSSRGSLLLPSSGLLTPGSANKPESSTVDRSEAERTTSDLTPLMNEAKELAAKAQSEASELAAKAQAEATELAGQAAAFASEKAPLIKEKINEIAASAKAAAAEKAPLLRETYERLEHAADEVVSRPGGKRKIAFGVAAGAVAAVIGGWLYASHTASVEARRRVDAFVSGYGLSNNISYADVSASPFGAVTLSGVLLKTPGGNEIARIGSLDVSGVDMRNGVLSGVTLAANKIDAPLLAISRSDWARSGIAGMRRDIVDLLGLGYTVINGGIFLSVKADPGNTIAVDLNGEVDDMGGVEGKLLFSGVSLQDLTDVMNIFRDLNRPAASVRPGDLDAMFNAGLRAGMDGMAGLAGLQKIERLSLDSAEIVVNNRGYVRRGRDVTNFPVPSSKTSGGPDANPLLASMGLASSEEAATSKALNAWRRDGGKLKIVTRLARPERVFSIDLFGNSSSFLFQNFYQLVARTNAEVTF